MFYSNKREVNDNKKLLAEIIPSMQNQPHSKINTNTKSPMLLTQLVLQYQIKCNTNGTIVILRHNKSQTYSALIDNYEKISFVLVMYVLLNHSGFFIYSK